MAGFEVQVLGTEDLRAALAGLPAKMLGKVMRPALRAGAKVVMAAAVAEAPVASGALAANFHVRAARKPKRGTVGVRVATGTKAELGIPETTKDGHPRGYYPTAQQFGWRPGNRPGTAKIKGRDGGDVFKRLTDAEFGTARVPANPFMTRAFDRSKDAAVAAVAAEAEARIGALSDKALAANDIPVNDGEAL